MTKNEYLIELATKLQALHVGNNDLYPEMRRLVGFYQEMIEDRIEDGLTEEEAVAGMERVSDIVERVRSEFSTPRIEVGEPASEPDEPRTTARASGKYTYMTKSFDPAPIKSITVIDANRPMSVCAGEELKVEYVDGPDGHYEVFCEGGALSVQFHPEFSLRSIFRIPPMQDTAFKLTLPRTYAGDLDMRTSNGSFTAEDLTGANISLRTSNGRLTAQRIHVSGKLRLVTSNGGLRLNDLTGRDVTAETSNGRVEAERVGAEEELVIATSNGANNVHSVCGRSVRLKTNNGHLSVEHVEGESISLTSSNGAVTGSIVGRMEDYAITSRTSNSKNNLPAASAGQKPLEVRTSNARIDIAFVE